MTSLEDALTAASEEEEVKENKEGAEPEKEPGEEVPPKGDEEEEKSGDSENYSELEDGEVYPGGFRTHSDLRREVIKCSRSGRYVTASGIPLYKELEHYFNAGGYDETDYKVTRGLLAMMGLDGYEGSEADISERRDKICDEMDELVEADDVDPRVLNMMGYYYMTQISRKDRDSKSDGDEGLEWYMEEREGYCSEATDMLIRADRLLDEKGEHNPCVRINLGDLMISGLYFDSDGEDGDETSGGYGTNPDSAYDMYLKAWNDVEEIKRNPEIYGKQYSDTGLEAISDSLRRKMDICRNLGFKRDVITPNPEPSIVPAGSEMGGETGDLDKDILDVFNKDSKKAVEEGDWRKRLSKGSESSISISGKSLDSHIRRGLAKAGFAGVSVKNGFSENCDWSSLYDPRVLYWIDDQVISLGKRRNDLEEGYRPEILDYIDGKDDNGLRKNDMVSVLSKGGMIGEDYETKRPGWDWWDEAFWTFELFKYVREGLPLEDWGDHVWYIIDGNPTTLDMDRDAMSSLRTAIVSDVLGRVFNVYGSDRMSSLYRSSVDDAEEGLPLSEILSRLAGQTILLRMMDYRIDEKMKDIDKDMIRQKRAKFINTLETALYPDAEKDIDQILKESLEEARERMEREELLRTVGYVLKGTYCTEDEEGNIDESSLVDGITMLTYILINGNLPGFPVEYGRGYGLPMWVDLLHDTSPTDPYACAYLSYIYSTTNSYSGYFDLFRHMTHIRGMDKVMDYLSDKIDEVMSRIWNKNYDLGAGSTLNSELQFKTEDMVDMESPDKEAAEKKKRELFAEMVSDLRKQDSMEGIVTMLRSELPGWIDAELAYDLMFNEDISIGRRDDARSMYDHMCSLFLDPVSGKKYWMIARRPVSMKDDNGIDIDRVSRMMSDVHDMLVSNSRKSRQRSIRANMNKAVDTVDKAVSEIYSSTGFERSYISNPTIRIGRAVEDVIRNTFRPGRWRDMISGSQSSEGSMSGRIGVLCKYMDRIIAAGSFSTFMSADRTEFEYLADLQESLEEDELDFETIRTISNIAGTVMEEHLPARFNPETKTYQDKDRAECFLANMVAHNNIINAIAVDPGEAREIGCCEILPPVDESALPEEERRYPHIPDDSDGVYPRPLDDVDTLRKWVGQISEFVRLRWPDEGMNKEAYEHRKDLIREYVGQKIGRYIIWPFYRIFSRGRKLMQISSIQSVYDEKSEYARNIRDRLGDMSVEDMLKDYSGYSICLLLAREGSDGMPGSWTDMLTNLVSKESSDYTSDYYLSELVSDRQASYTALESGAAGCINLAVRMYEALRRSVIRGQRASSDMGRDYNALTYAILGAFRSLMGGDRVAERYLGRSLTETELIGAGGAEFGNDEVDVSALTYGLTDFADTVSWMTGKDKLIITADGKPAIRWKRTQGVVNPKYDVEVIPVLDAILAIDLIPEDASEFAKGIPDFDPITRGELKQDGEYMMVGNEGGKITRTRVRVIRDLDDHEGDEKRRDDMVQVMLVPKKGKKEGLPIWVPYYTLERIKD